MGRFLWKLSIVSFCSLLLTVAGCGGGGSGCTAPACGSTDYGGVFEQCGPVDLVFIMDTSGSMDDEAGALCAELDNIIADLVAIGLTDLRDPLKWSITNQIEAPDDDPDVFDCLTDSVLDVFESPIIPGTTKALAHYEDWGGATAVVAELGSAGQSMNFQWRPDAIKIIIPISDEGPDDGDSSYDQADTDSIANAISFASFRGVIVSPIIGSGAEVGTSEHALDLAAGTGGTAKRSTEPGFDLAQLIFDIVFVACEGRLLPPDPPTSPGPTMLVAVGRDGGIYQLNESTGAETLLVDTPISGETEDLTWVSSMIYNEETNALWAGVGGDGWVSSIFSVGPTGTATFLFDNVEELWGHAGMAQRRIDRAIAGSEGDDELDIQSINNVSGEAVKFADDIDDIADLAGEGQGLTFVGNALYLASGQELWDLDTFSGYPTKVADLTLSGFPVEVDTTDFRIGSMTTRPSDNTVFALLKAKYYEGANGYPITFLCTVNVSTGVVTNIGPQGEHLDGITWVPAGYFTTPL